jgi:prepilin-type N-terminal cleavage/methylation domain-containing protein/prepilin-type processing-associated H-X9-DG protein
MAPEHFDRKQESQDAFTLVELLVVISLIAVLAALLFPGLSRVKAASYAAKCKSNLHQTGVALQMYVGDYNRYPSMLAGDGVPGSFQTWTDRLSPNAPLNWTNRSWHCPTYIANNGRVEYVKPPPEGGKYVIYTSYSYNAFGIAGWRGSPQLGLGLLPAWATSEPEVQVPSEMYTVADARAFEKFNGLDQRVGLEVMNPYFRGKAETAPSHAQGYNILFADCHVFLVKRSDYLYPSRTAHNWNRDNQPHSEAWAPSTQWLVQR